jgi:uncharacterized repeat protein (TIGR03803 family)
MTHKERSRQTTRPLLLVVLILTFASTASAEWNEKVLYSFQGGADGSFPGGGLIFDKAGNLYGVTVQGGATNCPPGWCGTIYELNPPKQKGGAWTEAVLYVFKGHDQNDGSSPTGSLIADSAGNMYGVTGYGGSGPCVLFGTATGCGTVYELRPPKQKGGAWTETVLYNFQGGKDGDLPSGTLVFDTAGNLYGVTLFGGGKGTSCDIFYGGTCGTVFKLSPPKKMGGKWTETVLHSFAGIDNGKQYGDGAEANGSLVLDSKGAIYGTTYIGGYNCPQFQGAGCGTVFELKPPTKTGSAWTEKILQRFTEGSDGGNPNVGLIFDTRGALYGTTAAGGTQDSGVVFRFTQANGRWAETVLHSFQGTKDQSDPQGLVFDSLGNLYCSSGSIVRLKSPTRRGGKWVLTVLYEFKGPPDGRSPTDLTFGKGTTLYGTTLNGGNGQACQGGCGTVFEVSP